MKISSKLTVAISLLTLSLLLFGTKQLTDNKRIAAEQEVERLQPQLKQIAQSTAKAYRFPLDTRDTQQSFASFNTAPRFPGLYHSAIDYYADVGDPVYAIADGSVSYSGRMEGYPGLVIIDHQKEGIYSLYGHLSLNNWMVPKGEVEKGALLGYIAAPSESEGIGQYSHLHFAIRLGQRRDYPEYGVDRWMAGYTPVHPVFKRFIDPEKFIILTMSERIQ